MSFYSDPSLSWPARDTPTVICNHSATPFNNPVTLRVVHLHELEKITSKLRAQRRCSHAMGERITAFFGRSGRHSGRRHTLGSRTEHTVVSEGLCALLSGGHETRCVLSDTFRDKGHPIKSVCTQTHILLYLSSIDPHGGGLWVKMKKDRISLKDIDKKPGVKIGTLTNCWPKTCEKSAESNKWLFILFSLSTVTWPATWPLENRFPKSGPYDTKRQSAASSKDIW